mmetsp:Transcript_54376/g.115474  ORF Transcript_54376/g.115474 Transcript_54376/m.115474 type:complete len:277 (+) Transcript_54376:3629-4459(+)
MATPTRSTIRTPRTRRGECTRKIRKETMRQTWRVNSIRTAQRTPTTTSKTTGTTSRPHSIIIRLPTTNTSISTTAPGWTIRTSPRIPCTETPRIKTTGAPTMEKKRKIRTTPPAGRGRRRAPGRAPTSSSLDPPALMSGQDRPVPVLAPTSSPDRLARTATRRGRGRTRPRLARTIRMVPALSIHSKTTQIISTPRTMRGAAARTRIRAGDRRGAAAVTPPPRATTRTATNPTITTVRGDITKPMSTRMARIGTRPTRMGARTPRDPRPTPGDCHP